jgi:hypothetical protein
LGFFFITQLHFYTAYNQYFSGFKNVNFFTHVLLLRIGFLFTCVSSFKPKMGFVLWAPARRERARSRL